MLIFGLHSAANYGYSINDRSYVASIYSEGFQPKGIHETAEFAEE